jgi:hypothetical protein
MLGCLVGRLTHVLEGLIGGMADLLACLRCCLVRASTGKAARRLLRHMTNLRGAAHQAATLAVIVIV